MDAEHPSGGLAAAHWPLGPIMSHHLHNRHIGMCFQLRIPLGTMIRMIVSKDDSF